VRRLARPLLYGGVFAIVVGLGRLHAQFVGHYVFHSSERLPWSLVFALLLCVVAYAAGLPDLDVAASSWGSALATGVISAGLISVAQIAVGSLLLPRLVIFSSAALVIPWSVFCSRLAAEGRSRDEGRDRVVAVVSEEEADVLRTDLSRAPERSAVIVRDLRPAEASGAGSKARPIVEAVLSSGATVLVLDRDAQAEESIVAQAAELHEGGVRVRTLSLFYEEWLGKLPMSELERVSLMFDIGEVHRARYGRVKRIADIVLALAGVVVLVPLSVIVVAGNTLANRGPILYRQMRLGKNGQVFEMIKFRTMRSNSADGGWTSLRDPRVTPFGRWLRRAHLDELPQVVNILRGELSIVGPRPEQPKYAEELREKIPFYDMRQRVRPGLTGWAQVKYRYAASESDALEKLQYEFYYLRHQDLSLDVRIVGRTLRSVFLRDGR
jgi:lipopolysaccharide/colanic/teichoic acid biosynthesis glycosyltransferase